MYLWKASCKPISKLWASPTIRTQKTSAEVQSCIFTNQKMTLTTEWRRIPCVMWFGSMLAAVCVARVRNWALRSSWLVVVFSVAVTSSSVSWSDRFGADRSRVRLSAGSNQDLVNWYCSLLTRRTVCGRAAGNTLSTQNRSERNATEIAQTQSWRYKTLVVIKCLLPTTITNKQTKVGLSMFASCQFTFCSCFIRCRVSVN